MIDPLEERLEPADGVLETSLGDETVLLHLAQSKYYGLDMVGTLIWEFLKRGVSPGEACVKIAEEFGISLEQARGDARDFIVEMRKHGILVSK